MSDPTQYPITLNFGRTQFECRKGVSVFLEIEDLSDFEPRWKASILFVWKHTWRNGWYEEHHMSLPFEPTMQLRSRTWAIDFLVDKDHNAVIQLQTEHETLKLVVDLKWLDKYIHHAPDKTDDVVDMAESAWPTSPFDQQTAYTRH